MGFSHSYPQITPIAPIQLLRVICVNGYCRCDSMAGDVSDGPRRVDGWLSEKVQAQLGILALPFKQCAVHCMGRARSCLCAHLPPALPCLSEYQGSNEEPPSGSHR